MNKDKIVFKYVSMKKLKDVDKRYIKLMSAFIGWFKTFINGWFEE